MPHQKNRWAGRWELRVATPPKAAGGGRWCGIWASMAGRGLIAANAIIFFGLPHVAAAEYVVFPFLIWAALRFGPAGSVTAAVITSVVAVWGTHMGGGPFAGAGAEQGLVPLQIFMAVAATTGLLLGAVVSQDSRAKEELGVRATQLAEAD